MLLLCPLQAEKKHGLVWTSRCISQALRVDVTRKARITYARLRRDSREAYCARKKPNAMTTSVSNSINSILDTIPKYNRKRGEKPGGRTASRQLAVHWDHAHNHIFEYKYTLRAGHRDAIKVQRCVAIITPVNTNPAKHTHVDQDSSTS